MRNPWQTFAFASAFAAAVLVVSTLSADSPQDKGRPMMDHGNMMGRQMGGMGEMMEGCSRMMGMKGDRSHRPNEQWRKQVPSTPEKKS